MNRLLTVLNPVNLLAMAGLNHLLQQAGLDPMAVLRDVAEGRSVEAGAAIISILAVLLRLVLELLS